MKPVFLVPLACCLLASLSAANAVVEGDLGQGLAYLRTTEISDDVKSLETALSAKPAVVVDLRSARADYPTAMALRSLLAKKTGPKAGVRLVLIGDGTAPLLIATFTEKVPGVVTLGPIMTPAAPDVTVAVSAEDDRRAFDALVAGATIDKLVNTTPDKERFDEAKLVRDHANGLSHSSASDDEADDSEKPASAIPGSPSSIKPDTPRPIVDLVLQRAVQLHRALIALKRL